MGRPQIKIDEAQVLELARKGARNSEIGFILGVDEETIKNRFSGVLDKTRAERRVSLRDRQYAEAIGGNVTMLIWLGKQELDQSDKAELKTENRTHVEIEE